MVAGGFVSESVVATYLVQATENNIPLSVILIQRHGELRDVVLNTLGQLARMRVVDLEAEPPMGEIRNLLPPMLALEYRAIPLGKRQFSRHGNTGGDTNHCPDPDFVYLHPLWR